MLDYQIVRSHRKTLALQVKRGQVIVRAPHFIDEDYIGSLVQEKSIWLKKKIAEQTIADNSCCDFSQGSQLFYLGRLTTLNVTFGTKAATSLSINDVNKPELTVTLALSRQLKLTSNNTIPAAVKKQLELYFKQQTQQIIIDKTAYFSELIGLVPTAIKIRQYRARWGSCNSRGELSFNYLMMMLPDDVIDYIVVHELCHLRYLNHSPYFWQLVAKYFPNYRQAKQWLKTHQSYLLWHIS